MLKTKTRVFLPNESILGQRTSFDVSCFIDLNYVVAYYELPVDDEYPKGGTNICVGNHDITILMNYDEFELIYEEFLKNKMIFNIKFN